jgi:DNA-binding MarR family transcriptional regulator
MMTAQIRPALFRRLTLGSKSGTEPSLECSREEIRALILLGASGQTTMTSLADRLGVPLSTATHTVAAKHTGLRPEDL